MTTKLIPVRVILDTDDIAIRNVACKTQCVGGHACVCVSYIKHTYHICKRPDCECKDALREGVAA